jgi:hypothetical protein
MKAAVQIMMAVYARDNFQVVLTSHQSQGTASIYIKTH